ncbi:MAG: DUF2188 domain-containing protein [Polyangiales bacterium]
MTKTAFRVRPDGTGWVVVDGTGASVSKPMRTQSDAIAHAKVLAKAAGGAHVIVFDDEDCIDHELYYVPSDRVDSPTYVTLNPMPMSRVSLTD